MRVFFPLIAFLTLQISHSGEVGDVVPEGPKPRVILDKQGGVLPNTDVNSMNVDWELLKNTGGEFNQYKAVGAMLADSGKGSCTLTLIEPPGGCALKKDQPALALTNGHCAGMLKSNKGVETNLDFKQEVSFSHFVQPPGSAVRANITKTVYATMQRMDVAVVQLDKSYAALEKDGIKPKKIAQKFGAGKMANVAVPTDGIPREQQFVRRSYCSSKGPAVVMEGPFYWPNQLRMGCSVVGGASGSGLFDEASGELMGLMNTGVPAPGDGAVCAFNRPCEVDGAQPRTNLTNYGFDATFLHKCATATCAFDAKNAGCPLPSEDGPHSDVPDRTNEPDKPLALDTRDPSPFEEFKVKWGAAGSVDCTVDEGYDTIEGKTFTPPIVDGEGDGSYVMCVRGLNADGTWQEPRDATVKAMLVDRVPPVAVIQKVPGGYKMVSDDKSETVVAFKYKVARSEKECAAKEGYKLPGFRDARVLTVTEKTGYLCVLGLDLSGNWQPSNGATILNLSKR